VERWYYSAPGVIRAEWKRRAGHQEVTHDDRLGARPLPRTLEPPGFRGDMMQKPRSAEGAYDAQPISGPCYRLGNRRRRVGTLNQISPKWNGAELVVYERATPGNAPGFQGIVTRRPRRVADQPIRQAATQ
jgi:hypothetical protein